MMKNILCYGDSNTYGYDPDTGKRHDRNIRWTGRLQKILGDHYNVIEEGCNGRTTDYALPEEPWRNGMTTIHACIYTHKPVDLVILMLGTNDLKDAFHAEAEDIAGNIRKYLELIHSFTKEKQEHPAEILLMAPACLGKGISVTSPFSGEFSEASRQKSLKLAELYRKAAEEAGCMFLNASDYVKVSDADSLHLDNEAHYALAHAIAEKILEADKK